MWTFNIKKEDKRRKSRLAVGSHVVDASSFNAFSLVMQNLSIWLLLLITKANNLQMSTGDVGNSCLSTNVGESAHFYAKEEWGDKNSHVLETTNASHGLKTSTWQWSLCLGNALREMGFKPSQTDPDLWMKLYPHHSSYDWIGTFVDELIMVSKEPLQCSEVLARKLNLRNATHSPSFFLGTNWENDKNRTRISNESCIKDNMRNHEEDHDSIRK